MKRPKIKVPKDPQELSELDIAYADDPGEDFNYILSKVSKEVKRSIDNGYQLTSKDMAVVHKAVQSYTLLKDNERRDRKEAKEEQDMSEEEFIQILSQLPLEVLEPIYLKKVEEQKELESIKYKQIEGGDEES